MKPKFTRAQITRSRWLRGRLNYKLHDGQLLLDDLVNKCPNQLFVGEIARQFGKTYWLAKRALEKAFSKPKAKIKIGTAFHTDLVEFVLPAFEAIMEDCPRDLKPVYKSQQSKFVLPHNGSEIKLVGLDRKPNGLRGTVPDLIILDECGFVSRLEYLYRSVIIPATTHRPDCRVLMFSTPPETPAHEFLDLVQKAELEGGYCRLTIYDNPRVDQATIDRLMKESGGPDSTTWKREYLCMHVTDAAMAIISDWKDEYCQDILKDEFFQFYHLYAAMDLGVTRDYTAVIFGYYDFKRAQLIIEHEYTINGPTLTTEVIATDVKNKEYAYWGERKPYRRVSDNNNPLLLQDLSHIHGLHFTPTDKGRLEEMVNTVKIMVRSGGIIVHPRCKQLLGCLKYGIWDKNRDKFALSKVYGHFDALAALIYLCRNLDRVTNPIPIDYRLDPNNQILFNRGNKTAAARTIASAFGIKR